MSDLVRGKGKIEIIFGPMFSGKTTELIRRMTRYQIAKFKCLVIKYAGDTRYSTIDVATHDEKTIRAVSCSLLTDLEDKASDHDVIGIDEGQFFPDIIEFSERLANRGKVIIVAALDGTFQRTGFGEILNLVPLAESVVKLNAVCVLCYDNASFTQRTSSELAVEIIGGSDKYMAVCRKCHVFRRQNSPHGKIKRSPLKNLENGAVKNLFTDSR